MGIGFEGADKRLERELEKRNITKIVNHLKKLNIMELLNSVGLETIEKFKKIVEIFIKINPNYLEKYNDLEKEKPEKYRSILPESYSIGEIVNEIEGDEALERIMSMYYLNKIAHECEHIQKKMLQIFCEDNKISKFQEKDFYRIHKSLNRYFDTTNANDKEGKCRIIKSLDKYGIKEKDLKQFEKNGYSLLSNSYKYAMYMKDYELHKIIAILKKDEYYSFGLSEDEKRKPVFVVDVPYYGQMSVHIKSLSLISKLNENEYSYPIYNKKSIMYPSILPKQANERMIYYGDEGVMLLQNMFKSDPRMAHDIAVKAGFSRDEIRKVHDMDERG